jgi:hypothetical protein
LPRRRSKILGPLNGGIVYQRSERYWPGIQDLQSIFSCSSEYALFKRSENPNRGLGYAINGPPYRRHIPETTLLIHPLPQFSLFLQREGAEDVLDFWLDVQQHENLCRAYFKDLKKSGKAVKDEWPQYYDFAR